MAPIANAQVQYVGKNAPLSEEQLKRWSHLDLISDTIPGMSVDKAYRELLKGKKSTPVIVGVVDSGVDIEHPDPGGRAVHLPDPLEFGARGQSRSPAAETEAGGDFRVDEGLEDIGDRTADEQLGAGGRIGHRGLPHISMFCSEATTPFISEG